MAGMKPFQGDPVKLLRIVAFGILAIGAVSLITLYI